MAPEMVLRERRFDCTDFALIEVTLSPLPDLADIGLARIVDANERAADPAHSSGMWVCLRARSLVRLYAAALRAKPT